MLDIACSESLGRNCLSLGGHFARTEERERSRCAIITAFFRFQVQLVPATCRPTTPIWTRPDVRGCTSLTQEDEITKTLQLFKAKRRVSKTLESTL